MACAMALADSLEPSVATRICLYIAPPAVKSGPILCRDLRVVAESGVRQFTAQALPSDTTHGRHCRPAHISGWDRHALRAADGACRLEPGTDEHGACRRDRSCGDDAARAAPPGRRPVMADRTVRRVAAGGDRPAALAAIDLGR